MAAGGVLWTRAGRALLCHGIYVLTNGLLVYYLSPSLTTYHGLISPLHMTISTSISTTDNSQVLSTLPLRQIRGKMDVMARLDGIQLIRP
jgi:hypothetical protein